MATILVIEDNQAIRENIAEVLEMASYQVLEAADGKQGIILAETRQPDLIVCDLSLPILDGFVVLQMLNNEKKPFKIPFIFLTARAERAEIRKGMEMGADDYITKPFNPSELLSAIECQLKKAAHTRSAALKAGGATIDRLPAEDTEPFKNLIRDRNIRTFKNKQIIYQEGTHPSCLYFILKGFVKAYRIDEDGKEMITGLFKEGDFLGYIPVLERSRYNDTAEAIDQVIVSVIPVQDFEELMGQKFAREQMIKMLTHTIEEKELQLLRMAYDSLRKRAADTLLTVFNKYNVAGDQNVGIKFSRGNLAALAGVAKESFARTLADFRDEHLIEIRHGVIYLLDIRKLNQLSN
ncbi:response regulator [Chitinophaga sancti]|uniref:Crp-like helix-turn-helix domain-containing protein n=1 Tax=Chitinophaga sancti TaxID=1004 RepID=A0A1K1SMF2_9BACT|nr:response regulator [Chitinophaga sancti]WQD63877.1 response regulator [Chitinophaga sancti]WQG90498.1 response regulator [Chitinophaga sancti]SFW85255.1 Crp-like helix-turn-helix domain-containing protein [Chitinophaga sancti]